MSRRKFSDIWYEHGRNPYEHLKEHWYQQFVLKHFRDFGFSSLEGPFKSGPDFKGVLEGYSVTVEVETEYLAYRHHGHRNIDVLIVGVVDPPHPDMVRFLPQVVINLDPQLVMDWSKPFREAYKAEMETKRETLAKELDLVHANLNQVKGFRILKRNESLEVTLKEVKECDCGGMMLDTGYNPELDGEITEGQMADNLAGFWIVLECENCRTREWVQNADAVGPS